MQGVLFTADADGGRSVFPAAKVSLDGPIHIEAQSDHQGKFGFSAVPPGSYTITAQTPGMAGAQKVQVIAGTVSEVEMQIEMEIQRVGESTTVVASAEPAETKEPSGTNTVGESAIRNMPNIDEYF